MHIGLFIPCFIDLFYPQVAIATLRVLQHLGMRVDFPAQQTCCGQAHFNTGRLDDARDLARRFCTIFSPYDCVVSPSGSCTAMIRNHYPTLIGNNQVCERTFELCEFIVQHLGITQLGAQLQGKAALHIGCHQMRELRAAEPVRTLMNHVQDLSVLDVESATWCCGFGGAFSVKFPELSTAMGKRKLSPILAANVDYLISTDASCLMHLNGLLSRNSTPYPRALHIAEVLATCTVQS